MTDPKQIDPQDDTSIFQIFERLNTGGVILQGQEIRNCIYDGSFNESLNRLNEYNPWRKLFGSDIADKRKRDVELILRFFALFYNRTHYEKPMKQFLNSFNRVNRRADQGTITKYELLFKRTCDAVMATLGEKPFNIHRGLNAAVYDSIFTAFAGNLTKFDIHYKTAAARAMLKKRFEQLTTTPAYLKLVSVGTTDEKVIPKRIRKAERSLFV